MAITRALLTAGGTGTDATSFVTASISPTAGLPTILWVMVKDSVTGVHPSPAVSGAGLIWVEAASTAVFGGDRKLRLFIGTGTPTPGAVTIDFGADTLEECFWVIEEFTETESTGFVVQHAADGSGTLVLTFSVTLGAFSSSANGVAQCFSHAGSIGTFTPGTGFTAGSQGNRLTSQWRPDNDTSCDASWTTSKEVVSIAIEIKSLVSTFIPKITVV